MTVHSQNGWEANNSSLITHISIPGGSLTCRAGDVATIFQHLATRFNNEVERLIWPGCWGYAEREVRGSTDISNHASGTAIDLNAPKHPLGTDPMQNYNSGQISAIHNIVSYYEGVIRWGGDYIGRKDGMHFEINDGQSPARVAQIAAKVRGGAPAPAPTPEPTPQPATAFPYSHDQCFGLISDPSNKVHGGINAQEKVWVKQIQQKLQELGFAPAGAGWADGIYEKATVDAVAAWQRAKMPGTTIFGQVWFDDWAALIQGQYPTPPAPPAPAPVSGEGARLPTLSYGQTNGSVKSLQAFCNRYNWVPALPLISTTGFYGDLTARVLHLAGQQLGVDGDTDGKNFGPHFKDAFWRIGFRG